MLDHVWFIPFTSQDLKSTKERDPASCLLAAAQPYTASLEMVMLATPHHAFLTQRGKRIRIPTRILSASVGACIDLNQTSNCLAMMHSGRRIAKSFQGTIIQRVAS